MQDEEAVDKEDDVKEAEEEEDEEDVEEVDKVEESVDVGSGRTVGESEVKVDVEESADGVKVDVGSKDEEVLGLRGESEVQAVAGSGSEEVEAVGESDVQVDVGSESEESWSDEVYLG